MPPACSIAVWFCACLYARLQSAGRSLLLLPVGATAQQRNQRRNAARLRDRRLILRVLDREVPKRGRSFLLLPIGAAAQERNQSCKITCRHESIHTRLFPPRGDTRRAARGTEAACFCVTRRCSAVKCGNVLATSLHKCTVPPETDKVCGGSTAFATPLLQHQLDGVCARRRNSVQAVNVGKAVNARI